MQSEEKVSQDVGPMKGERVGGDWNVQSMCGEWQVFYSGMEPGLDE